MTNNELEAALQETMAVLAMALNIINDVEDRLGLRKKWENKANTLLGDYFDHVRINAAMERARYKDYVGD